MKTKVLLGVSVLVMAAWTAQAVEDGLGTNVVRNIRIQTNGVIDLGNVAITNWNQVGSTADVAALQGATGSLNSSVGNLNSATTALNLATGALNIAVNVDLKDATNLLNSATGALNTAVGTLNARTNYWNNGVIIYKGTSLTALAAGNLYYLNGATNWTGANAVTNTTAQGLIGLALGANIANDGLLLNGQFSSNQTYAVGAPLYMGTNDCAITTNAPFRTNHVVRIVGYVIDANTIMFNPDRTYIEILGE